MKSSQIGLLLVLFVLMSGCSTNMKFLLYTPDNMVPEGLGYDQSMRDHIAKLEKGPMVAGSACSWLTHSNEAIMNRLNGAHADAIRKAGPGYDALTNVNATSTHYPLFFSCSELRGTATKNEPYYATKNTQRGIDKTKGESK